MLRNVRIFLAFIFFTSVTLLFLDFTGTLNDGLGWVARIQFLPALLSLNVVAIVGIILLTFLFGRLYCSTICPFGVLQDIISRLAGNRKKKRFTFLSPRNGLRYGVLILFVLLLAFDLGAVALWIAPYSAYGRVVTQLATPIVGWGNNELALLAARGVGYIPGPIEIRPINGVSFTAALITLAVIFVFAWRAGRLYCNTICPVGTLLGFLSRRAVYKPRIDSEQCVHCGICAKICKAACIDGENQRIDLSRCVVCGDCLEACRTNAIHFGRGASAASCSPMVKESSAPSRANVVKKTASARRKFLIGLAILFSGQEVTAQPSRKEEEDFTQRGDGGLAPLKRRILPQRATKIAPPGAKGLRHFYAHCTGCQLCVASCSNHVLRPSTSFKTIMKPEVSFENGWCRPECVECSNVCPTGAIRPITMAEKSVCQTGHAVWTRASCIVLTDDVQCDNCFRQCPTEAIIMVPLNVNDPGSKKIPTVDEEKCIGCGACEFLCPARPVSALHVEGHERHRTIYTTDTSLFPPLPSVDFVNRESVNRESSWSRDGKKSSGTGIIGKVLS